MRPAPACVILMLVNVRGTASGLLCLALCAWLSACVERNERIRIPVVRGPTPEAVVVPTEGTHNPAPSPAAAPPEAEAPAPTEPDLTPYFDGTDAQKAFWSRRWSQAATEYATWLESHPDSPDRPRATLLLHTSQLYAGDAETAAPGLDGLVGKLEEIDSQVRLLTADAWIRCGQPENALLRLDGLTESGFAQARRGLLLRARALLLLDRFSEASAAFRTYFEQHADAPPAVWLEYAEACAGLGEEGQEAAAAALRQVMVRAPHTSASRRADARLRSYPRTLRSLTVPEKLERLRAQYAARWHSAVVTASREVHRRTEEGSDEWCEAGYLAARSLERARKRPQSLALFKRIEGPCGQASAEILVDLMYFNAKRHLDAGEGEHAMQVFTQLQELAPDHSYVDDTWIWQAQVQRELGNDSEADTLLTRAMLGAGDMQEKASWLLFWHRYESGDLSGASTVASQAVEALPRSQVRRSRGRILYWAARVNEQLGETESAVDGYQRCIREFPLSYYEQLARQRLSGLSAEALTAVLEERQTPEAVRPILTANRERLNEPEVQRATELLRLGFQRAARTELDALRFGDGDRVMADWLLALLYARVGDDSQSHRIARGRRPDYADHFPAHGHEERWRLAFPRPQAYRQTVEQAANQHDLEPALVWAVMRTESAFRSDAVSVANAVGLMQLIIPTGRAMARREGVSGTIDRNRLKDPLLNIRLGTRYLGRLSARFEGHPALIASGYNAGPGRPAQWLERDTTEELDVFVEKIPYRETRRYTKSVITSYLRYRFLYGNKESVQIPIDLPRQE